MSRIDEALRRATAESAPSPAVGADGSVAAPEPLAWEFPEDAPAAGRVSARTGGGRHDGAQPVSPAEALHLRTADKLVVSPEIPSVPVEQYRRLAATLHHAQLDRGIKSVIITSAVVGEGKTLTATNLALTLSESYHRRVLLVDADLRRPTLHNVFHIPPGVGLQEALRAPTEQKFSLVQISRYLTVLPAGRPDLDPMSILVSARMRRALAEASAAYDWVILDSPPVGLLTDTNLLAAMVDTAVLVIRAGSTPHGMVQRAVDNVGRDRIIGVVLNGAREDGMHGGYGYDTSYYGNYAPVPDRPTAD